MICSKASTISAPRAVFLKSAERLDPSAGATPRAPARDTSRSPSRDDTRDGVRDLPSYTAQIVSRVLPPCGDRDAAGSASRATPHAQARYAPHSPGPSSVGGRARICSPPQPMQPGLLFAPPGPTPPDRLLVRSYSGRRVLSNPGRRRGATPPWRCCDPSQRRVGHSRPSGCAFAQVLESLILIWAF